MNKFEWKAKAYSALVQYAKRSTAPFTTEQARTSIQKRLDAPPELRWWGDVTQEAIRRGVIKAIDFAPARSSNGSPKPVYVRAV